MGTCPGGSVSKQGSHIITPLCLSGENKGGLVYLRFTVVIFAYDPS